MNYFYELFFWLVAVFLILLIFVVNKYGDGLFGFLQRCMLAIVDWRTIRRKILGQPTLDVVFISNMRHSGDKKIYLGSYVPPEGHFNGPRIVFQNMLGRTRALNVLASDLYHKSMNHMKTTRRISRKYYLSACQWAQKNGAQVILSGASLKELFGRDVKEAKKQFPKLLFTKGDNGTIILFWRQCQKSFELAGLSTKSRIGFLCPYNTNGKGIMNFLVKDGYSNVVLFGSKPKAVEKVSRETGFPFVFSYAEMGEVDALICCSHSQDVQLKDNDIQNLRKKNKKLLILTVAQPPNPEYSIYEKCQNDVIVISTGNGYSSQQKYILGDVAAGLFGFANQHFNFGCYLEAISLAYILKNKITKYGDPYQINWFETNEENMLFIERIFNDIGISPFPMASYSKINNKNSLYLSQ